LASVQDDDCGANVLFTGTTRRMTGDQETTRLAYECYRPMALAKIESLLQIAKSRWPIAKASVVHRAGVVEVGQVSIAVAVACPHRAAAFESAAWLLERLKHEVPIWKQENWADGRQEWVHPEGVRPNIPEEHPGETAEVRPS
jgi:molybdopterin synthase catalytic subunit